MKNKPDLSLNQKTQEFDATGQVLGRIASRIAIVLRGKDKVCFRPNLICGDKVIVHNAAKIVVTGNKANDKIYYHHTGWLGHLKAKKMKDLFSENPGEVLRRAVIGMLPKNKLRDIWMKNLTINN